MCMLLCCFLEDDVNKKIKTHFLLISYGGWFGSTVQPLLSVPGGWNQGRDQTRNRLIS
jgi:hypothetical protein